MSDDLDGECLLVQAKNVEVDDHSTEFVPPEEISSKDIFIFNNGSVVFWNIPQLERQKMMEDFHNFETSYDFDRYFSTIHVAVAVGCNF